MVGTILHVLPYNNALGTSMYLLYAFAVSRWFILRCVRDGYDWLLTTCYCFVGGVNGSPHIAQVLYEWHEKWQNYTCVGSLGYGRTSSSV